MPLGVVTTIHGKDLCLRAAVLEPDGRRRIEADARGPQDEAVTLGQRLADILLTKGARDLLTSSA